MATIQGIYIALFGRPADPEGLDFWSDLTSNGADLAPLVGKLTASEEYLSRFEGLSNAEVITNIYLNLFGREPEPEGLAFFLAQLESGNQTIETIAINILDGAQGSDRALIDAKVAAADLFTASLDTDAEIAAYNGLEAADIGRAFIDGVDAGPDGLDEDALQNAIDQLLALGEEPGPTDPGVTPPAPTPTPTPTPPVAAPGTIVLLDADGEPVEGTPFSTIQQAIDLAEKDFTVVVGAGQWSENVTLNEDGVTLRGEDGAEIIGIVRLEASDIVIDNFVLNGPGQAAETRGLEIAGGDDITVRNMEISNFKTGASLQFASSLATPSNVTFENNTFTGNGAGIGSTEGVEGLIVTGNRFVNNDEGIGLGAGVEAPGDEEVDIGELIEDNTFTLDGNEYAVGDYREKGQPIRYVDEAVLIVLSDDSIQAVIDAAPDNATILIAEGIYVEKITIEKPLTLIGLGDVTIAPDSGNAISVVAGVNGDVTIDGIDLLREGASTASRGLDIAEGANIGTFTYTNGSIEGFKTYGINATDGFDEAGAAATIANLIIRDAEFRGNGSIGNPDAQVKLFGFAGTVVMQDVLIDAGTGRVNKGIEITGGLTAPDDANAFTQDTVLPVASIILDEVTVLGTYTRNPVAVFNFETVARLSIDGLDLSGAESDWSLLNIDGISNGVIDASNFDVTWPQELSGKTLELQGAKYWITDRSLGQESGPLVIIGSDEVYTDIRGGADDDLIIGGERGSMIFAGPGDDMIDIRAGGVNTLKFLGPLNGVDTITGFDAGAAGDVLDFFLFLGRAVADFTTIPVGPGLGQSELKPNFVTALSLSADIAGVDFGTTSFNALFGPDGPINSGQRSNDPMLDNPITRGQSVLIVQGNDQTQIYAVDTELVGGGRTIREGDVQLVGVLDGVTNAHTFTADNFA
ncbi:DUF4214 domain-containing protein [Salinarimonas ramus]|uniref:DUF4214 domain-containing protein n=1 Tax=Salinarimonas ramus TaxID=690164 RepID=A0A917QE74_9HYPH|nr:DUF4214 domain-containing protein [Salinarimonas ramus]GGK47202.1 hypothetical protein GCM10011322_37800 [Salinarimonas ramus]